MRISFGREKAGQEFTTDREINDYVCKDFGDGFKFSQSGDPVSPYIRKVGKVKRDECWNKPARIAELVSSLYSNTTSKLHFGFLKEHGNSFYRIVAANVSVHKDNSVFLPTLNDPENHPLSNEIITKDILSIFIRSHQNDLPGGLMLETADMMVMPPAFKEWNGTQKHRQQLQPFNIFGSNNVTPTGVPSSVATMPTVLNDELIGITFCADWAEDEEVSVFIDGNLTRDSLMVDVMVDGEVRFELGCGSSESYKYLIHNRSGGKMTLK